MAMCGFDEKSYFPLLFPFHRHCPYILHAHFLFDQTERESKIDLSLFVKLLFYAFFNVVCFNLTPTFIILIPEVIVFDFSLIIFKASC